VAFATEFNAISGVKPPQAKAVTGHRTPKATPRCGKEKKVEGRVTVDIVIGEDGNVVSATPASGPDPLHGAARDAAFKARFRPTMVNGKPAKVSGKMSYNFVLDK
jgi:TonB family protein